jgi:hypothetical protein
MCGKAETNSSHLWLHKPSPLAFSYTFHHGFIGDNENLFTTMVETSMAAEARVFPTATWLSDQQLTTLRATYRRN